MDEPYQQVLICGLSLGRDSAQFPAAFAVTAVGMTVSVVGIVGMQLFEEGYWDVMTLGVLAAFVGSALFSIATYRLASLSRGAALLLGVSAVLTIVAGLGGNILGPAPLIVTSIGFTVGWFVLGIRAIRLNRTEARIATRLTREGPPRPGYGRARRRDASRPASTGTIRA